MGIHYPTQAKVRLEWGTQRCVVIREWQETRLSGPSDDAAGNTASRSGSDPRMVGIVGSWSFCASAGTLCAQHRRSE
jgi:hypothetical protein